MTTPEIANTRLAGLNSRLRFEDSLGIGLNPCRDEIEDAHFNASHGAVQRPAADQLGELNRAKAQLCAEAKDGKVRAHRYERIAMECLAAEHHADAEQYAAAGLELDADTPHCHIVLGLSLVRKGCLEEAISHFADAARLGVEEAKEMQRQASEMRARGGRLVRLMSQAQYDPSVIPELRKLALRLRAPREVLAAIDQLEIRSAGGNSPSAGQFSWHRPPGRSNLMRWGAGTAFETVVSRLYSGPLIPLFLGTVVGVALILFLIGLL